MFQHYALSFICPYLFTSETWLPWLVPWQGALAARLAGFAQTEARVHQMGGVGWRGQEGRRRHDCLASRDPRLAQLSPSLVTLGGSAYFCSRRKSMAAPLVTFSGQAVGYRPGRLLGLLPGWPLRCPTAPPVADLLLPDSSPACRPAYRRGASFR